jgi:tetrahydromethanopterin S-methyltransferase subunit B
MEEKKYNFDIIFKKFEEVKEEQRQIEDSDFIISKEIKEQIRELKKYYDDLSQELETYTRS